MMRAITDQAYIYGYRGSRKAARADKGHVQSDGRAATSGCDGYPATSVASPPTLRWPSTVALFVESSTGLSVTGRGSATAPAG